MSKAPTYLRLILEDGLLRALRKNPKGIAGMHIMVNFGKERNREHGFVITRAGKSYYGDSLVIELERPAARTR